jgi:membrane protein implicated in regulation of membrane protease activity
VVEGLGLVVILAFMTLIFGVIGGYFQIIIPQILLLAVVVYLLIRVRVKIAKAEKEKLRTRIDELEDKIKTLAGEQR